MSCIVSSINFTNLKGKKIVNEEIKSEQNDIQFYNLICKDKFEDISKNFDKAEVNRKEIKKEVIELKTIVTNGLSDKVSMLYRLLFWFIGLYITITGLTAGAFYFIIKFISDLQIG